MKTLQTLSNLTLRIAIFPCLIFFFTSTPGQEYTWSEVCCTPDSLMTSSASVLDNKLYVSGGSSDGVTPLSDLIIYDPSTDSWSDGAGMNSGKWFHGSTVCNDKLYAIGGGWDVINDDNEVYDPGSDSWTKLASMPSERTSMGVASVNGKIYVIGGFSGNTTFGTNEMYDPATDTWTTMASMNEPRLGFGTAVLNDKIYVVGGTDAPFYAYASVEMYDPATDTWEDKASMSKSRFGVVVATLNNKLFAIGGTTSNYMSAKDYVEMYDPATDTWETIAEIPNPTQWGTACATNTAIYVIGGEDKCCMTHDDALLIDRVFKLEKSSSIDEPDYGQEQVVRIEPNPFTTNTSMHYNVKNACAVNIQIHDLSGKKIHSLVVPNSIPGEHSVRFNASELSAGIYIATFNFERFTLQKKLIKTY